LKIALDENIPVAIVKFLEGLAKTDDSEKIRLVSARKYRPISEVGDEHWVRRFARVGGKVVISGDRRIRANLHEQAAFFQAGMITFFFEPRWNTLPLNTRAAMLMQWWPSILERAKKLKPGDFWEIPFMWNVGEMKFVSPPEEVIKKYKPAGKIPPRRKRGRRD